MQRCGFHKPWSRLEAHRALEDGVEPWAPGDVAGWPEVLWGRCWCRNLHTEWTTKCPSSCSRCTVARYHVSLPAQPGVEGHTPQSGRMPGRYCFLQTSPAQSALPALVGWLSPHWYKTQLHQCCCVHPESLCFHRLPQAPCQHSLSVCSLRAHQSTPPLPEYVLYLQAGVGSYKTVNTLLPVPRNKCTDAFQPSKASWQLRSTLAAWQEWPPVYPDVWDFLVDAKLQRSSCCLWDSALAVIFLHMPLRYSVTMTGTHNMETYLIGIYFCIYNYKTWKACSS